MSNFITVDRIDCPKPSTTTQVDKLLLREVGCALIARNEHGRRAFGAAASLARTSSTTSANGGGGAAGATQRHGQQHGGASGGGGSGGDGSATRGPDCGAGSALVYLAHCKPELGNALLDANWTPAQLASFAVIGEAFDSSWWTTPMLPNPISC